MIERLQASDPDIAEMLIQLLARYTEACAEVDELRELLTNAVLLMRPGSDLCKRTLAALGHHKST